MSDDKPACITKVFLSWPKDFPASDMMIETVEQIAKNMICFGLTPYIPWPSQQPMSMIHIKDYDLDWLKVCDAVFSPENRMISPWQRVVSDMCIDLELPYYTTIEQLVEEFKSV